MASTSHSSFTFKSPRQRHHLFPCKYNPSTFNLFLIFSPPKHSRELSPLFPARENLVTRVAVAKLSATDHERPRAKTRNSTAFRENRLGFRSLSPRDDQVSQRYGKKETSSVEEENDRSKLSNGRNERQNQGSSQRREMGHDGNYSVRPRDNDNKNSRANGRFVNVKRNGGKLVRVEVKDKANKGSKKFKLDSPEFNLRIGLDSCSKKGDVKRAIELFDSAQRDGVKLSQYHYAVLLYLCSSAAVGLVRPAKSGTRSRSWNDLEPSDEDDRDNDDDEFDDNDDEHGSVKEEEEEEGTIRVDGQLKEYARKRGFEIFKKMSSDREVEMNEAVLTSVARLAMSSSDADMAFDMVKRMKSLGISPKLRSYGPALSAFCSRGDMEKAFEVEKHMLENGVSPEEPELQALLRLSVGAGNSEKVYYLLHKLREYTRTVSDPTADLIADWFESKQASRVGKVKWDKGSVKRAMVEGGGGWHGKGWLGRGKWSVVRAGVGTDGVCLCCGEKLAVIDLDSKQTEEFAESVASIALEREKNSSFQRFQKWLDYYGPFEAVVDGANVGLFSQKRFMPSKINSVVNGIRQKLPSKKWPLVILHNKRLNGPKMDEPLNRALVDKWRNADAIFPTPTGSNDDWYWLYAAIKFKSFIVTNDEMRDHTFQLLGNDFFPIWKERHQVRFTFSDSGMEFHMPPPCSVIIQESEKGHWHIPISSEHDYRAERPWLCIVRAKSGKNKRKSEGSVSKLQLLSYKSRESEKIYKNLRDIVSGSNDHRSISILPKLERAEKLGDCTIDFDI